MNLKKQVERMKNALLEYYNAETKANEEREEAENRYRSDIASAEIEKINAQLLTLYNAARDAITAAEIDAHSVIEQWAQLNGDNITSDAKLLKFDLPKNQFLHLVQKNSDNATMLFLLKQYAEKHSDEMNAAADVSGTQLYLMNFYDLTLIPDAENRKSAISSLAGSALSLLDSIRGNGFGKGTKSPLLKTAIDGFGDISSDNAQYYFYLQ